MDSRKQEYKKVIREVRGQLSSIEKACSSVIHQPVLGTALHALENTFFRIIPMQFGFTASIAVGALMLCIAYFFGYQIVSLSVLGYVFVLGFAVGYVYEIIKSLIKQTK